MCETNQRSTPGSPSLWPSMRSVRLGTSSDINDGSARASHANHFPQRPLGIIEVVKGSDRENRIETVTIERQIFRLSLREPDGSAGSAAAAGLELGTRDVHPHDAPVGGQPIEIDAVTDGHIEQVERRGGRQMPQHLVAHGARRRCKAR